MTVDDPTLTIARLCRVLECNTAAGLSLPQYRVLGLLAGGDEPPSLLASPVSVAKPTLTSIVDSLFERGFVAREIPAGDRRSVRLSITRSGRAQLREAAGEFRSVLDSVLAECANPEAVLDALAALGDALEQRLLASEGFTAPGEKQQARCGRRTVPTSLALVRGWSADGPRNSGFRR